MPAVVGGRDLQRARDAARETGAAGAVNVDLDQAGLGLGADSEFAAVIALAPDHALHGLRYAQDHGIAYASGSTWLAEAGAELALFAHRPTIPVLLASHWWGGSAMFLALRGARRFESLHTIRIGAVIDEHDATGPAAVADMERSEGASTALALEHGHRVWLAGEGAKRQVRSVDGRVLDADAYAPLDIVSLQAATEAANIRFDLATSTSSSRLRGGPVAAEVVVELEGESGGRFHASRSTLEFPGGQASLTGLSVAMSLPAIVGLDGHTAAGPGVFLPELLSETDWFLDQLVEAGATVREDHLSQDARTRMP